MFATQRGRQVPKADAVNEAGGAAYKLGDRHALAQLAVTGCLNNTYYIKAEAQLEKVLELCNGVDSEFVAKCAVYSREAGYMKDMPALLCAVLASRSTEELLPGQTPGEMEAIGSEAIARLEQVFHRVIDNGRMLRGFVQIVRSGVTGRKSFGRAPMRLIREWLAARRPDQILRDSVGTNPSLADIVKMVHPRPKDRYQSAMYAWLLGKEYNAEHLPGPMNEWEVFKRDRGEVPNVSFQMLAGLDPKLGTAEWTAIAKSAKWMMTRMNLNTFLRHGVFDQDGMTELIAARLRDPEQIRGARAFPYQLMAAYCHSSDDIPFDVREALQDALDIAVDNVPEYPGNVFVCPDVSASMESPVTGWREGATTQMRCVDVAALIAAAVLRKNPQAVVMPFEGQVVPIRMNPRDSVMTNGQKLADLLNNGTNLSAPLVALNKVQEPVDTVIFISDYESWLDRGPYGAGAMVEWEQIRARCPEAKCICINLTPASTHQFVGDERDDILRVGGFSDTVFSVMERFLSAESGPEAWISGWP